MIKCILMKNGLILVSEIEEMGSELGEPDCKLINPYKLEKQSITGQYTLEPWMDFTSQKEFMIHSDSILTITDPKENIISLYTQVK